MPDACQSVTGWAHARHYVRAHEQGGGHSCSGWQGEGKHDTGLYEQGGGHSCCVQVAKVPIQVLPMTHPSCHRGSQLP
jgi:hypothetical protein